MYSFIKLATCRGIQRIKTKVLSSFLLCQFCGKFSFLSHSFYMYLLPNNHNKPNTQCFMAYIHKCYFISMIQCLDHIKFSFQCLSPLYGKTDGQTDMGPVQRRIPSLTIIMYKLCHMLLYEAKIMIFLDAVQFLKSYI